LMVLRLLPATRPVILPLLFVTLLFCGYARGAVFVAAFACHSSLPLFCDTGFRLAPTRRLHVPYPFITVPQLRSVGLRGLRYSVLDTITAPHLSRPVARRCCAILRLFPIYCRGADCDLLLHAAVRWFVGLTRFGGCCWATICLLLHIYAAFALHAVSLYLVGLFRTVPHSLGSACNVCLHPVIWCAFRLPGTFVCQRRHTSSVTLFCVLPFLRLFSFTCTLRLVRSCTVGGRCRRVCALLLRNVIHSCLVTIAITCLHVAAYWFLQCRPV